MGVNCSFDGRNDLVIDGQKFSGNAQHFHKNRLLHHGTLLFSSDIADISGALRIAPEKYQDKAVKSISKRVTNISSHLPAPMEVTEFIEALMQHVSQGAAQGDLSFSTEEIKAIEELAHERYRAWDWNYGFSPAYNFSRTTRTPGGLLEVHLDVDRGVIRHARLFGDYFGVWSISELEDLLVGCRHERTSLENRLKQVPLNAYIKGVDLPTMLNCLF